MSVSVSVYINVHFRTILCRNVLLVITRYLEVYYCCSGQIPRLLLLSCMATCMYVCLWRWHYRLRCGETSGVVKSLDVWGVSALDRRWSPSVNDRVAPRAHESRWDSHFSEIIKLGRHSTYVWNWVMYFYTHQVVTAVLYGRSSLWSGIQRLFFFITPFTVATGQCYSDAGVVIVVVLYDFMEMDICESVLVV